MAPANLTKSQRMAAAVRGAQYSSSLGQWIGFLFDGLNVTVFDPRTTRARALDDAHRHYDRVFHEQQPGRLWVRP